MGSTKEHPVDEKNLGAFIERTTRLSSQRHKKLSAAEIRAVAREVGLSEKDLEEVAERGRASIVRGREFMARQRWRRAIGELQDAVALLPASLEPEVLLARAYAGRFLITGDRKARKRADEIARRCLQIEPTNQTAYDVLNLISAKPPARDAEIPREGSKISVVGLVMTIVFGVIPALLTVLFFVVLFGIMIFIPDVDDDVTAAPPATLEASEEFDDMHRWDESNPDDDETRWQGTHEVE